MKLEIRPQIGFAELALSKRKIKDDFFNQINIVIDWKPISRLINKYYQKETVARRNFIK